MFVFRWRFHAAYGRTTGGDGKTGLECSVQSLDKSGRSSTDVLFALLFFWGFLIAFAELAMVLRGTMYCHVLSLLRIGRGREREVVDELRGCEVWGAQEDILYMFSI